MATATVTPEAAVTAPAAAPVSAPAAASTPAAPAETQPVQTPAAPSTNDRGQYRNREEYAQALLDERLKGIGTADTSADSSQEPKAADEAVSGTADETASGTPHGEGQTQAEPPATPAEEQQKNAAEQEKPEEEFVFELDADPETVATPEVLSQMVKENEGFARLLEENPKLKGQLYRTAREAAELAPYREIFPDIEAAKSAQAGAATWNDMRDVFLGSTTRDGALAALARIAELSYERDEDGNVLTENGQPVLGQDFLSFVDHTVKFDMEDRLREAEARLAQGGFASEGDGDAAEQLAAAYRIVLEDMRGEREAVNPAESVRRRQEELDRRERALAEREHGRQVETRKSFEQGLQQEAQKRIANGIERILGSVEKQGGVISQYLRVNLPRAIGEKLIEKIQSNAGLQAQMRELQRLPVGDQSRQRRIAAIDHAIQQYLPEVAREELRAAGVQILRASQQQRERVKEQAEKSQRLEPKGATGMARQAPVTASRAYEAAEAEWRTAHPGRLFDSSAKQEILPRVLELMRAGQGIQ